MTAVSAEQPAGIPRVLEVGGRKLEPEDYVALRRTLERPGVRCALLGSAKQCLSLGGAPPGRTRRWPRRRDAVDTARVEVLDVALLPADTVVDVGEEVHYQLVFVDPQGTAEPQPASWSVSDTTVAPSEGEGVFHARAAGSVTIHAVSSRFEDVSRTATLTVRDP